MRGGYQIIPLNETLLVSGTGATITGTYSRITNSNKKALLVTGLAISPEANGEITYLNDEFVEFLESESGFTGTLANGGTITVTNADVVTYTGA